MKPTYCKHLRTKSLFVGATPEEAFADKVGADTTPCHYWCNLTQREVGVDDGPVHKQNCNNSSRSCFEE